jgi:hypothetical protein
MPLQIEPVVPVAASRRATLSIAPEILLSALQQLTAGHLVTVKGLPADAKVTATRFDDRTGLIQLRLVSAEFREVPDNEIAPDLDVMFAVR